MNSTNPDDIWLQTTDSKILRTGFADFVTNFQRRCQDEGAVKVKLETEGHKSDIMSSPIELSISSSLTSIGPLPAISQLKPLTDDAGFNRFLDEWTDQGTKEAKLKWDKMSKRERAFYAPKDFQVGYSSGKSSCGTSAVERLFIGEVSSGAIRRTCDKICADLVKSHETKSKGQKSKKCAKPKGVGKGFKPLGARSCPKKCPKPKSDKKCRKTK